MKYYSLYPEESNSHGVAYAPEWVTFKLLYRKSVVFDWQSIDFILKDGCFTDYQWNNLGWHLCSEKLKGVITECAGVNDTLQWLSATVSNSGGEKRNYYILHLPIPCDVLSTARTIMSGDMVVKPVLDFFKVETHNVFTYSSEGPKVYISEATRKRIMAAKVTGLDFLKVPVVES